MLREILPPDTALAFEAMRALRTHHGDEAEFVRRVDEEQRPQGYRIVGAVEGDRVVAVAGFRVLHNLAGATRSTWTTSRRWPEARGRGHGRGAARLVRRGGRAARLPPAASRLRVGPEREEAHRLYLNTRLRITAYHFSGWRRTARS